MAGRLKVQLPELFVHKQIDIEDHPCADILSIFEEALNFIDQVMFINQDDTSGTKQTSAILVHCASGISRSVAVCCAWIMTRRGTTFSGANSMIRACRPRANPNVGFSSQLVILENCNGSISAAISAYRESEKKENIMSRTHSQRDRANIIHLATDELEIQIKRLGSTADVLQLNDWIVALHALEFRLNEFSLDQAELIVRDRPAEMIRKSASAKVDRLLAELQETLLNAS